MKYVVLVLVCGTSVFHGCFSKLCNCVNEFGIEAEPWSPRPTGYHNLLFVSCA